MKFSGNISQDRSQRAFTIVELLIVIVVIAILAAITIVAFNGIQQRARDQRMVSAASQVYKAISLYVTDTGSYPTGSISCVGTGYPVDAAGLCYSGHSNLEANTNLLNYVGSIPSLPMERLSFSARGMLINTSATPKVLEYTIISSSTCPSIGAALSTTSVDANGDLWCRAILPSL